jgi:hypothetical protein
MSTQRDFEPEVIVSVSGSLSAQMWHYAIGHGAGMASGLPVSYDLSGFEESVCELADAFPDIDLKSALIDRVKLYRRYFFAGDPDGGPMAYDEAALSSGSPRYLGGRYLNAKYVDGQGDTLRDCFSFKQVLSEETRFSFSSIYMEDSPVAVHLSTGVASPRYFRAAVRMISERISPAKAVFFVFSSDETMQADIFADTGEEFVFVERNAQTTGGDAVDMYLMSRCKHFIISNSLLGWWPAWLSRESSDKIVIMPDKWLPKERHKDAKAMNPQGWTILSGD